MMRIFSMQPLLVLFFVNISKHGYIKNGRPVYSYVHSTNVYYKLTMYKVLSEGFGGTQSPRTQLRASVSLYPKNSYSHL